jgi:hypothetical protein
VLALGDGNRCWTASEWRMALNDGQQEGGALREATYSGRPLGSDEFVSRLEESLKRRLRRGAPGRPAKEKNAHAATAGGNVRNVRLSRFSHTIPSGLSGERSSSGLSRLPGARYQTGIDLNDHISCGHLEL